MASLQATVSIVAVRSTRSLNLVRKMESSGKLKSANLLMGIGLLACAGWGLLIASMKASCGFPVCDLTTAVFVVLFGVLAYCVLLGIGGLGVVSAGRQLRANPAISAPVTRALRVATVAMACLPWAWVAMAVVKRSYES